jgi:hypothetical protein
MEIKERELCRQKLPHITSDWKKMQDDFSLKKPAKAILILQVVW